MDKTELNQIIRDCFKQCLEKFPQITYPYIKFYEIHSNSIASYNPLGFSYSKKQPTIKINLYYFRNYDFQKSKYIILHEFCHLINHQIFNHFNSPHHNKKFYELCLLFNLPYDADEYNNSIKNKLYNIIK